MAVRIALPQDPAVGRIAVTAALKEHHRTVLTPDGPARTRPAKARTLPLRWGAAVLEQGVRVRRARRNPFEAYVGAIRGAHLHPLKAIGVALQQQPSVVGGADAEFPLDVEPRA